MLVSSLFAKFEAVSIVLILMAVVSTQSFGAECTAERKTFTALVDGGAATSHNLTVAGNVQCSSTGWKVRLARAQGKNPHDLVLKLEATPPDDMAGQIVSDVGVQFLLEDSSDFQTVTIKGGGLDFTIPVVHQQ
ncbi:MAG TPA: hypothetical protein VGK90_01225 [Rhizomicrobium sp.]|jgi:hypothetical protein